MSIVQGILAANRFVANYHAKGIQCLLVQFAYWHAACKIELGECGPSTRMIQQVAHQEAYACKKIPIEVVPKRDFLY